MQANMTVPIDVAHELLTAEVRFAIEKKRAPKNIFLHGTMGIGKSAIVHQLRAEIEKNYNFSEVVLIDLRLSSQDETALLGIPYTSEIVNSVKKEMFFSTPEWFPTDKDKFYILFLDEFSNGSKSTQQAAYRLVLDREINNGKKLGDNVMIVSAGNLKEDKTGAKPVLPAAGNRFAMHLFIDEHNAAEPFLKWAIRNGINEDVISYISYDKEAICSKPDGNISFARPRTWEYVSDHLDNTFLTDENEFKAIAAAIGKGEATKFYGYLEYKKYIPDWKAIREGRISYVMDSKSDIQYAVTTPLAFEICRALDEGDDDGVANLCTVGEQLTPELKIIFTRIVKMSKSFSKALTNPRVMDIIRDVTNRI